MARDNAVVAGENHNLTVVGSNPTLAISSVKHCEYDKGTYLIFLGSSIVVGLNY